VNASNRDIAATARDLLQRIADPVRAREMAAYMKTQMPFFGVPSRDRKVIVRTLSEAFPATTRNEYQHNVRALWRGPHREEKYLAVGYARSFSRFVTLSSIPLYRTMITSGAWWDFVDEIAAHLVGTVLLHQRVRAASRVGEWATAEDMWLRRSSILSQLRHKQATDTDFLDRVCTANLRDREFFIQKATGWALREYAKTSPAWVLAYVDAHEDEVSGLTRREALKHLG